MWGIPRHSPTSRYIGSINAPRRYALESDMNFTLTRNSPLNTELVGPGVTYTVQTPGILKRHTTVSRGGGAAVAQIDWHVLSADVLRMGSAEMKVGEFLQRAGILTSKRKFTAGGTTYTWHPSRSGLTLYRDKTSIATMEHKMFRGTTLHVSQEAASILDALVVTMIIMWRLRQRARGGGEGGGGGDGGGGGGGDGGGGC